MAISNAEKCRRYKERHPKHWEEWVSKNPNYNAERNKKYKDRERQKAKRWAENNRKKRSASERKRYLKKAGVFDSDEICKLYNHCCGICGEALDSNYHIDHIVPLSKGGLHVKINLQPAHSDCNLKKHANWPSMEELERK